MQFKIHSTTDRITNSSTVIFTYSDGSVAVFKDLVNEILKTFGASESCDDIFDVSVEVDQCDLHEYIHNEIDSDDERIPEEFRHVNQLKHGTKEREAASTALWECFDNITNNKVEKPGWFNEMVEQYKEGTNYMNFPRETWLSVSTKDPKYDGMAKLLVKFLYSTSHDGGRNG